MLAIISCFLIVMGLVFLFAKEQLWNWGKRKAKFWRYPPPEEERPEWFDREYTVWGLVILGLGLLGLIVALAS